MTYLRGVVAELRAAQGDRPPGAHVAWPEIEWPEASAEPPDTAPVILPFQRVEVLPEPAPVPEAEFLTTEQEQRRREIEAEANRTIKRFMIGFWCAMGLAAVVLLLAAGMRA